MCIEKHGAEHLYSMRKWPPLLKRTGHCIYVLAIPSIMESAEASVSCQLAQIRNPNSGET